MLSRNLTPSALVLWVSFSLLSACATPSQNFQRLSEELGLTRQALLSSDFLHYIYFKPEHAGDRLKHRDKHLHIYLEGDGKPWLSRNMVSADPTPRNPLALKLMAMDTKPSIYLNRPCYGERLNTYKCNPLIWTHQRYSATVVNSMSAVLKQYLQQNSISSVSFIGYSGGGVLAMLLANQFPQTHTVVTIAANLDTEAWTRFHGYSPLKGSLNPTEQTPLSPNIRQLHFIGANDNNVPKQLVQKFLQNQTNSRVVIMKKFDHICCWEQEWPKISASYNF